MSGSTQDISLTYEGMKSCLTKGGGVVIVTSLSEQDLEIASFLTVLITHPIHEQISNLISVSLKYENWSFQLKIMLSH